MSFCHCAVTNPALGMDVICQGLFSHERVLKSHIKEKVNAEFVLSLYAIFLSTL